MPHLGQFFVHEFFPSHISFLCALGASVYHRYIERPPWSLPTLPISPTWVLVRTRTWRSMFPRFHLTSCNYSRSPSQALVLFPVRRENGRPTRQSFDLQLGRGFHRELPDASHPSAPCGRTSSHRQLDPITRLRHRHWNNNVYETYLCQGRWIYATCNLCSLFKELDIGR